MVKQSHVALELFTRSSVSHHSHLLEQCRTQANSHQKRRTGAIGPFSQPSMHFQDTKPFNQQLLFYRLFSAVDDSVVVSVLMPPLVLAGFPPFAFDSPFLKQY